MALFKSYGPDYSDPAWVQARTRLAMSDTRIAQIDTGLYPHPSIGFLGSQPPANIAVADGRNFYDPATNPYGTQPLTDLSSSDNFIAGLTEFPDHGVKTLGVILSTGPGFTGTAPGAKIIPYRVSNGPVFRRSAADAERNLNSTYRIGLAIEHALALAVPPRVITISMGNPGLLPWDIFRLMFGGSVGIAKSTAKAVDRAYLRGIPVICAAGQIERSVLFPAVMKRCIAVAGFERRPQGKVRHYPKGGYNNPLSVESWALAVGLNLPVGRRRPDGTILAVHAADVAPPLKPEGTSFATPFIASAYALWFETYRAALTEPAFSGTNAWRRIEAFRRILIQGMASEMAESGLHGTGPIRIRRLDMLRLLQTPPAIVGLEKQPPFRDMGITNVDEPEDLGAMV